jgi:hypothetical protein
VPDNSLHFVTIPEACDMTKTLSRAIIFLVDWPCIFGGFENEEFQRIKISITRAGKSKIHSNYLIWMLS